MQDGSRPEKKILRLAVDAGLVARAHDAQIDLADLLEQALRVNLPPTANARESTSIQEWRRENAATFAAWNEEVSREGLWNDDFRTF